MKEIGYTDLNQHHISKAGSQTKTFKYAAY